VSSSALALASPSISGPSATVAPLTRRPAAPESAPAPLPVRTGNKRITHGVVTVTVVPVIYESSGKCF
jgi:hypothetical protein